MTPFGRTIADLTAQQLDALVMVHNREIEDASDAQAASQGTTVVRFDRPYFEDDLPEMI